VNARVRDICLAAGVTRPAFYALFEGKEDAFIAAYRYGATVLWRLFVPAHGHVSDWPGAVRCGLRTLLNTLAAVPSYATTAFVEIDAVGPAARGSATACSTSAPSSSPARRDWPLSAPSSTATTWSARCSAGRTRRSAGTSPTATSLACRACCRR
jgi:AcrR family transcriptional regulator